MTASQQVDGSILPFPAKPSGSKASTTMQDSTYSPLPDVNIFQMMHPTSWWC